MRRNFVEAHRPEMSCGWGHGDARRPWERRAVGRCTVGSCTRFNSTEWFRVSVLHTTSLSG